MNPISFASPFRGNSVVHPVKQGDKRIVPRAQSS